MFRCPSRALAPTLLAVCLTAAAAAPLRAAVVDEAGYFSAEAVRRADEDIQEVRRQTGKDLVIETVKGVPEDQARAVRSLSKTGRDEFFTRWAEERARDRAVDG